jgi:hypothetical protein
VSGKKVDPVTGEMVVAEAVKAATEVAPRKGDVISRYLTEEHERTDVASVDTHKAVIEEILASQTLDELLDDTEAESLDNFVDRVITIRAFSINDSEFPDGAPIYVAMKVTDEETGQRRVATTGQQNVMAQLLLAEQNGWLPLKCRPRRASKPNKYGNYMIRLGKAED